MADVINFTGLTKLEIPPDEMLEKAKGRFERVVIIGVTEGDETDPQILASDPSLVYVLFDLERAKDWVIREVRQS
jgi:hypothetical protein